MRNFKQFTSEAIKGWKNAHSDIMKSRAAAASANASVHLHKLTKDGKESGMHDARKSFSSVDDAEKYYANALKLNPGKKFKYNLYVDGKLSKTLGEEVVAEGENKQIKGGDPCWKGYQMVGMKNKGGRKVPNCVPANEALKPGWMLKAAPKLGAAVKAKQDLAKKRQASYGNPAAGKSVKESLKADLKALRTMIEEASYKVDVEGLPTMYVQSTSPTEVKTNLRKILKKADMIKSVDRIPDVEVKKAFRLKAMGKDEE